MLRVNTWQWLLQEVSRMTKLIEENRGSAAWVFFSLILHFSWTITDENCSFETEWWHVMTSHDYCRHLIIWSGITWYCSMHMCLHPTVHQGRHHLRPDAKTHLIQLDVFGLFSIVFHGLHVFDYCCTYYYYIDIILVVMEVTQVTWPAIQAIALEHSARSTRLSWPPIPGRHDIHHGDPWSMDCVEVCCVEVHFEECVQISIL